MQREVEDLTAVIDAVGGDVYLLGFSSGAGLAYETAASGASVKKVIGYEAPYVAEDDPKHRATDHLAHLKGLLADDSDKGRGKAVDYFMTTMVGGPFFMPVMMRMMGKVFAQLKAVAHTLPYDTQVMNSDFTVPRDRLAKIRVPVLVGVGGKAKPNMVAAEGAVHAIHPGQRAPRAARPDAPGVERGAAADREGVLPVTSIRDYNDGLDDALGTVAETLQQHIEDGLGRREAASGRVTRSGCAARTRSWDTRRSRAGSRS